MSESGVPVRKQRAMDKKISAAVFGAVFGAVTLLAPAAFAIPGVNEVTDQVADTVTDTVDNAGSGSSGAVDQVTDTVDETTGGGSAPVTDVVDETVDETTNGVSNGTGAIVDKTKETVNKTVEGVDKATGGAVTGTTDKVTKVFEDPLNRLDNPLGFRDRDGKLTKKERKELRETGGYTRKQIAALQDALNRQSAEARVALLQRREGSQKTAPLAFDQITQAVASPESPFSGLAQAAGEAAKKLAFPLALTLMVLGYLVVQGRIDGRDEKLALAPIDADQDLLSFS